MSRGISRRKINTARCSSTGGSNRVELLRAENGTVDARAGGGRGEAGAKREVPGQRYELSATQDASVQEL